MTVSIWQANGEQPVFETDVVVIGAGLLGCTAAIFLKQAGRSVTIVEARDVGLGASSRNAGFMLTGLDKYYHRAEEFYGETATREIWDLSRRTLRFWTEMADKQGVLREPIGSLLLAEDELEAKELADAARRMESCGFDCEFLSSDPLGRGYRAAIRQPGDGAIHPMRLVEALFKESGATLIENSEVYDIKSERDAVVVYSRKAILKARAVLICVNAYAARLDPYFEGKVIPIRAQCLATSPLPGRVINAVGYSDYGFMYYRDLPDGGLLLGGGRKENKAGEDDTADDRVTEAVQKTLEAYLQRRFPDVWEQTEIVRRWAGTMGFTRDGLPLVGSLPRDNRIYFALGMNGHGLSLGAATAERAVNLLLNGTDPGILNVQRLS